MICVVNVDATTRREGICARPAGTLGLPPVFAVHDVLRDETFTWQTGRNYVALDPGQSHVLKVVAPV